MTCIGNEDFLCFFFLGMDIFVGPIVAVDPMVTFVEYIIIITYLYIYDGYGWLLWLI